MRILNISTQKYLTVDEALRRVERGLSAFIGDSRNQMRDLEAEEQRRLRWDIAAARERLMDDELIRNGRRVVYWNASDPEGRHLPGQVRS